MTTITELYATRDHGALTRPDWKATMLTAALIIALAIVVGTPIVGVVLASVFGFGIWIAALEHRVLRPAEFAAVGALHAIAVVLLAV